MPKLPMIEVLPRATRMLEDYFKGNQKQGIRLFVKLGACGIRSFGVALEAPGPSDRVFRVEGFDYIIDKVLYNHVRPIKVDSDGFGFRISGNGIHPQHGCGSCGFMCGDGNRCTGRCAACEFQCAYGRRQPANGTQPIRRDR